MTDNPMAHRVLNRITAFCYALTILIVAGLIVTGLGLTGIAYAKETATAGNGVVCVRWVHDFETTIDLLKSDIAEKGIMFFDEIDQSGIGAKTGIQLRPWTLLIFGNPPLGIQFLTSNPYSGLDWPVRLLVTEDSNSQVWAVYTDFSWIARHHHITNRDAAFRMASEVIASVASKVAKWSWPPVLPATASAFATRGPVGLRDPARNTRPAARPLARIDP